MKNKKLTFTIIGIIVLLLFMVAYLFWCFENKQVDSVIITAWLTNLMLLISVYNGINVAQKRVISENYKKELDSNFKGQ